MPKAKQGRPQNPEKRAKLNTSFPIYMKRWLLKQPGGPSAELQRLVGAEMKRRKGEHS